MSKTAITSPELAPPVGPFSQAIEVGGFLYFSGQVGQDPATGKLVEGGVVAQTERVLQNLPAVLEAAGRSFDHVARAGVYLTSMSDFAAMNGTYAKYFSQPFPTRTTIAVAASATKRAHRDGQERSDCDQESGCRPGRTTVGTGLQPASGQLRLMNR